MRTASQMQILRLLQAKSGGLTMAELIDRTNLSRARVLAALMVLMARHEVVRRGSQRGTVYRYVLPAPSGWRRS